MAPRVSASQKKGSVNCGVSNTAPSTVTLPSNVLSLDETGGTEFESTGSNPRRSSSILVNPSPSEST